MANTYELILLGPKKIIESFAESLEKWQQGDYVIGDATPDPETREVDSAILKMIVEADHEEIRELRGAYIIAQQQFPCGILGPSIMAETPRESVERRRERFEELKKSRGLWITT